MTQLNLHGCEGIIELDLLMKPDYFPTLERIDLFRNNIVTVPESISRFPRLKSLYIRDCKLLREIQGLPHAKNCMLLDTQSPSGLLNQVIEIIRILPSRVCGRDILMDPQLTNYFPSKTEGAEYEDGDISMDAQFSNNFLSEIEGVEYEDGDIDRTIYFWGTGMPKWFNHQSVDNSIFFFVGRKFPKLAVCIVPGREFVCVSVHISINGYKKSGLYFRGLSRFTRKMPHLFDEFKFFLAENNLFLFSLTQRSLQRHLNKSNPTDQNLVEVSITYSKNGYSVKRLAVQEDDAVDYWPTSKKLWTF
ncbi:uncharacterized protein LOC115982797 isoform X1 [Quercus lobata]|uniref:uncharacterized protein LOC115982797 isoform X1 n=1 Tax=Quercus lobata TaxID=97700 RepID=UPI0012481CF5|nr:uncharacterized protein LOC115982797 isoform X1 [Quercus lobata]